MSITFYDNYVFSPRYAGTSGRFGEDAAAPRCPAVSLVYSKNGKRISHIVSEYSAEMFKGNGDLAECSIDANSFRVQAADYGSGYMLHLSLPMRGGRRIEANLEWLSIEANMRTDTQATTETSWNVVVPRADVSGRITIFGRREQSKKTFHFRGTGCHDHFRSKRSLSETFSGRQWGHAHFVDTTAFFCRQTVKVGEQIEKLYIVRDGELHERNAQIDEQNIGSSRYGAKFPKRLTLTTDDNIRLRIKPLHAIESGFCNVKMMSEMTLTLRDGQPRKAMGIADFLTSGRMENGLFRFLTGLGINRK